METNVSNVIRGGLTFEQWAAPEAPRQTPVANYVDTGETYGERQEYTQALLAQAVARNAVANT